MKNILIIASLVAVSTTSCIKSFNCIDGNGIMETESRNALIFNQIVNTTAADVIYRKSDVITISVRAESNLLDNLVTEIVNGKLEIRTEPGSACLDYNQKPVITVTSPSIDKIILSGSGDVSADTISGNSMSMELTGSGDLFAEFISCDELSLFISGSGNADIKKSLCEDSDLWISGSGDLGINGNCNSGKLRISGSGDINADDFMILTADETISGSGNIYTYVENSLTAVISGSGNIYLEGNPSINQTISGSGRIIKR